MALVLKDLAELSVEQVSEALGIKPATVKTRVHRARLMLRRALLDASPRKAPAPEPTYEKQVCIDLLRAKLDAMDRGRGESIGREVLCERCRSVFAELDLGQNVCARIVEHRLPPRLRERLDQLAKAHAE